MMNDKPADWPQAFASITLYICVATMTIAITSIVLRHRRLMAAMKHGHQDALRASSGES